MFSKGRPITRSQEQGHEGPESFSFSILKDERVLQCCHSRCSNRSLELLRYQRDRQSHIFTVGFPLASLNENMIQTGNVLNRVNLFQDAIYVPIIQTQKIQWTVLNFLLLSCNNYRFCSGVVFLSFWLMYTTSATLNILGIQVEFSMSCKW